VTREAVRRGPLTFAQEEIWDLHRRSGGAPWQNVSSVVGIDGEIDEPALERALQELVQRHEPLRTIYRPDAAGGQEAVVLESAAVALERADLPEDPAAYAAALPVLAREVAAQRFALGRGPLVRVVLARRGACGRTLFLCLDHTAADGWGLRVLARDLVALYDAARGRGRAPAPLSDQCIDHAVWERRRVRSAPGEAELRWWVDRLCRSEVTPVAVTSRTLLPVPHVRGRRLVVHFPPAYADALQRQARAGRLSLFILLLAAAQEVVERRTGSRAVIGTRAAARTARSAALAGAFRNVLVLAPPSLASAGPLERARQTVLAALERQLTPFPVLAAELAQSGVEASALLRVMLLLDGPLFSDLRLGQARLSEQHPAGPLATPSLAEVHGEPSLVASDALVMRSSDQVTFYLRTGEDGLWLFFFYKPDVLPDAEAARWLQDYTDSLQRYSQYAPSAGTFC
jgi:condensation domain-containing protein